MRNLQRGDLVKIVIDINDEDVDWLAYCTTDDINALWDNEGTFALVEDISPDCVNLLFHDNRIARKISKRHVRFVSAF